MDGKPELSSDGYGYAMNTVTEENLIIGRDLSNRVFTGWIDEVRIYDRALHAGEIRQLAGGGPAAPDIESEPQVEQPPEAAPPEPVAAGGGSFIAP